VDLIRMHVEITDDPDALDWVVRDGLVAGAASIDGADCSGLASLPVPIAELIARGVVARVVVQDGRIRVWRANAEPWFDLAPIVQQAIMDSLTGGTRIVMRRGGACGGCPSAESRLDRQARSRQNDCRVRG
jgi:hypothetical protein